VLDPVKRQFCLMDE